jgi:hypothetical protein
MASSNAGNLPQSDTTCTFKDIEKAVELSEYLVLLKQWLDSDIMRTDIKKLFKKLANSVLKTADGKYSPIPVVISTIIQGDMLSPGFYTNVTLEDKYICDLVICTYADLIRHQCFNSVYMTQYFTILTLRYPELSERRCTIYKPGDEDAILDHMLITELYHADIYGAYVNISDRTCEEIPWIEQEGDDYLDEVYSYIAHVESVKLPYLSYIYMRRNYLHINKDFEARIDDTFKTAFDSFMKYCNIG